MDQQKFDWLKEEIEKSEARLEKKLDAMDSKLTLLIAQRDRRTGMIIVTSFFVSLISSCLAWLLKGLV